MNIRFGYARVSTHDQTHDLQLDALASAGTEYRPHVRYHRIMKIVYALISRIDQDTALQCDALAVAQCERIFEDKMSGSRRGAERLGLVAALNRAHPGDQLVGWRLDRLGRSLPDLIRQVDDLQTHDLQLVLLQEVLDTSPSASELAFHMFGALSQFEHLIRERTNARLAAARARSGKGRRRPTMTKARPNRTAELMWERTLEIDEICRVAGVGRTTLYRHLTLDDQRGPDAPSLAGESRLRSSIEARRLNGWIPTGFRFRDAAVSG